MHGADIRIQCVIVWTDGEFPIWSLGWCTQSDCLSCRKEVDFIRNIVCAAAAATRCAAASVPSKMFLFTQNFPLCFR